MNRYFLCLLLLPLLIACSEAPVPATSVTQPEIANNDQVQNRGADKDNWWDQLPRPEWSAFERVDIDDGWFEVYRLEDEIYAIYEPGQFEEVISFLIIGTDFALMFDTGLGIGNIRNVVDQLTDMDIVVLNSHTHYDHIGGNHLFDTIYGTENEYTKNRALGSPPDSVAGFLQDGWVWKALPTDFDATTYQSHAFEIDRFVGDGELIDLGGRILKILFTPGHAPDSISLLDSENRLLFTGDTFYLAPLYTHLEGSSFDDYADSAALLAGLADEIDAAITSHNVPKVDASYITALGQAFKDIRAGTATNVTVSDGVIEYHFSGFSVMVNDTR
ncbi:MAG: MBL fold metallo-hydrolase [Woeseiaceae bacterium]